MQMLYLMFCVLFSIQFTSISDILNTGIKQLRLGCLGLLPQHYILCELNTWSSAGGLQHVSLLRRRQESPMCQNVQNLIQVLWPLSLVQTCQSMQNQNREEGSTRTKNGRVRCLPDMLALGRQNTAGARQQGSRCRGRRGRGSGPMATL